MVRTGKHPPAALVLENAAIGERSVRQFCDGLPPIREWFSAVKLDGVQTKCFRDHVVILSGTKNVGIGKVKWFPQNNSAILPYQAVGACRETDLTPRSGAIEYLVEHPPAVRLPDHKRVRDEVGGNVRYLLAGKHRIPKSRSRSEGYWGL